MSTSNNLMALFALFSSDRSEWSVEEAASAVGLSPSTTYRYFRSLADAGLIVAITAGRYVLGPAVIMLDRQMRRSDPLILASVGAEGSISKAIGRPGVILLCRLFRERVICVHSVDVGAPGLKVSYERGRPMPLFRGASSKVILASLPARNVRKLFEDNRAAFEGANLGRTWPEVKKTMRGIRSAGGAVTHGEIDPGLVGVASAIFGAEGDVVGSLGFVYASDDRELETKRIAKVVRSYGAKLTASLRL